MIPQSTLKQYESLFVTAFCEQDVEVYHPNFTNTALSKNNAVVTSYSLVATIKGSIGPRLRREAALSNVAVNDIQGEIQLTVPQADSHYVTDSSVVSVGGEFFNIRFDLNRAGSQEPLALYVGEKRSASMRIV